MKVNQHDTDQMYWLNGASDFEKGVYVGQQHERMKSDKRAALYCALAAIVCFYLNYDRNILDTDAFPFLGIGLILNSLASLWQSQQYLVTYKLPPKHF